jgi:hypothetical protein
MGIEETVARLREDVTAAQRRHAGADARATQAEARAAAAREDMQAEFGVSTVPAARQRLADLERQLEEEAAGVREQLELAGGTV